MAEQLEEVDPDVVEVRETNLASVSVPHLPISTFNLPFPLPLASIRSCREWTAGPSPTVHHRNESGSQCG